MDLSSWRNLLDVIEISQLKLSLPVNVGIHKHIVIILRKKIDSRFPEESSEVEQNRALTPFPSRQPLHSPLSVIMRHIPLA